MPLLVTWSSHSHSPELCCKPEWSVSPLFLLWLERVNQQEIGSFCCFFKGFLSRVWQAAQRGSLLSTHANSRSGLSSFVQEIVLPHPEWFMIGILVFDSQSVGRLWAKVSLPSKGMDPRFYRDALEQGGKAGKAPNKKYLCVLSCLFGSMNIDAGRSQLESEAQLASAQACETHGSSFIHISCPGGLPAPTWSWSWKSVP